jgi:hypothetical protein
MSLKEAKKLKFPEFSPTSDAGEAENSDYHEYIMFLLEKIEENTRK